MNSYSIPQLVAYYMHNGRLPFDKVTPGEIGNYVLADEAFTFSTDLFTWRSHNLISSRRAALSEVKKEQLQFTFTAPVRFITPEIDRQIEARKEEDGKNYKAITEDSDKVKFSVCLGRNMGFENDVRLWAAFCTSVDQERNKLENEDRRNRGEPEVDFDPNIVHAHLERLSEFDGIYDEYSDALNDTNDAFTKYLVRNSKSKYQSWMPKDGFKNLRGMFYAPSRAVDNAANDDSSDDSSSDDGEQEDTLRDTFYSKVKTRIRDIVNPKTKRTQNMTIITIPSDDPTVKGCKIIKDYYGHTWKGNPVAGKWWYATITCSLMVITHTTAPSIKLSAKRIDIHRPLVSSYNDDADAAEDNTAHFLSALDVLDD